MTGLLWLHHPRLKPWAFSPFPAWLWSADAKRVLWANATGAAILGAPTPAALSGRAFDSGQPTAAQIERLAETLPADETGRVESLRGFGAGIGRTLPCHCSRLRLDDGATAILVGAAQRAGPELPLHERVARLFGANAPVAAFGGDGTLIHATPVARAQLGDATSMTSLGAEALAALAAGRSHANHHGVFGPVEVDRFGDAAEPVFVMRFGTADANEAPEPVVHEPALPQAAHSDAPDEAETQEQGAAVSPASEAVPVTAPQAEPAAAHVVSAVLAQRRHPLRFVWQIDADGRFTADPEEFIALMGPRTAALMGQPWSAIASALGLDPDAQVARAMATEATWSGLTVAWPLTGSDERICVELSGLPVFDRERTFRGYRGFGVCRDVDRLNALAQAQAAASATDESQPTDGGMLPPPEAEILQPTEVGMPPPAEAEVPSPEAGIVEPVAALLQEAGAPSLSPVERSAFYELSRRLTGRINAVQAAASEPAIAELAAPVLVSPSDADEPELAITADARPFLDRLPVGVLVYRLNHLLYANAAFLTWAGYDGLDALAEDGGLDSLLIEPGAVAMEQGGQKAFSVSSPRDPGATVEARLLQVPWNGDSAFALLSMPANAEAAAKAGAEAVAAQAEAAAAAQAVVEAAAAKAEATAAKAEAALGQARAQVNELSAILDTATDGVVVLDRTAGILSSNRSAQALFGYDAHELEGRSFSDLFTPESVGAAIEHLDRLQGTGVASLLHDGREIAGREKNGGTIPLLMTMGRLGEDGQKFCAVFRDITQWKKTEDELVAARREAERSSSAKSEFLAKVSHEIRTPLNAIIGFSEVMMEERFGPVGNERYRQYLKDIHASGGHLISLVNDLLDLSKVEAGKLELSFDSVSLNDLTQQCVAIMQTGANRERIIIRTSLSPKLPPIVADARSVRQIVLNLLSNSIKFTVAGGQVIVSTATTETGDVVLRVRDTGIGMSEKDIATALEPFRQVATATRARSGGTGLGLPLTKALAEANHAGFAIKSAPNAGTLVEITFPPTRVLAQQS